MARPWSTAAAILLLLIPVNVQALEEPPAPNVVVSTAFRDIILQVNATVADVEEQVGAEHPDLLEARGKLRRAGQAHNAGEDYLVMNELMQAVTLAKRVELRRATADAADPDAAFYARVKADHDLAVQVISNVHETLLDLQDLGVDLWLLDHALVAGDLLTQGERVLAGWGPVAQSWEGGDRGEVIENGLIGFVHSPILHAEVADMILNLALQEQPDDPTGPVVGAATLRGTMETIQPLVANRTVSVDRDLAGLVNGNAADGEWLAALGASMAWSRQQAPAAVQHRFDKPNAFTPEEVIQRLDEVIENDRSLEINEELDIPGATAWFTIREALGMQRVLHAEQEQGDNLTRASTLRAAVGLGSMSAAHTGLAILQLVAGETPTHELIHLPSEDVGALELGPGQGRDEAPEAEAGSRGTWLIVALVVAAAGAGVYLARRGS